MHLSTAWELDGIKSQLESKDEQTRAQYARKAIGLLAEVAGARQIGPGYYAVESGGEIRDVIYAAVDSGKVKAPDVVAWVTRERESFDEAFRQVDQAFRVAMAIPASELRIVLADRKPG